MISKYKKQKVYNRDNNKCCKCGSEENLTIDHIIPKNFISIDHYFNLQLLCKKCNNKKGSKIRIYTKSIECINFVKEFREFINSLWLFEYNFRRTLLILWLYK